MKRCLMTVCCAALAVSAALAQQKKTAPPLPKPADAGPSLEVTMKFIQEKVTEQGKLNFAVLTHDDITGEDGAARYSLEVSNLALDAANCAYQQQSKFSIDNRNGAGAGRIDSHDFKIEGPVKSMTKSVQVMPAEYWWKLELAEEGTPSRTARVEPAYFVLSLGPAHKGVECKTDGKAVECGDPTLLDRMTKTWAFRDENTADRVAKAMVHAVELCGGGTPEPF
jgi:hypothetical protein